ncbi:hypothetical protein FCV25MIE_34354 [Fagus crenata]
MSPDSVVLHTTRVLYLWVDQAAREVRRLSRRMTCNVILEDRTESKGSQAKLAYEASSSSDHSSPSSLIAGRDEPFVALALVGSIPSEKLLMTILPGFLINGETLVWLACSSPHLLAWQAFCEFVVYETHVNLMNKSLGVAIKQSEAAEKRASDAEEKVAVSESMLDRLKGSMQKMSTDLKSSEKLISNLKE